MLRRAENVGVAHHAGLFTKKGWATLRVGKASYRVGQGKIHRDDFAQMAQDQQQNPVALIRVNERQYWWFGGHFFWDNDDLGRDQVYALLITRQQRQERQIARAEAIVAMGSQPEPSRRGAIPDDLKQLVWTRDGGQCRHCGSQAELQFDHVIPVALGGATSAENLQILCGTCNRRKGAGLTTA